MTEDAPAARAPRADSVRNRARVAEAAYDVYAEQGLGATVAQVAARAGVGNATVFRHFPTKADLLDEVAARWLQDWARVMDRRLSATAHDALAELLPALFERLRTDRFTLDVLRAGSLHPEVERARQATQRLFLQALERAIADGQVRPDVTYADLAVLVLGAAGQLAEFEDFDPDRWRRHALLVWSAIRA
ncbi:helix-turn-helix domain-containing protein [Nocardioides salarius]|uniref:TetR/AcrR family transcriptional regulator n=1 Tax=Nocardioides salarius TaxID=374513 RepID=UPI0030F984EE